MNIPKFLIADSSTEPEKIFILHTDFPRFLLEVDSEEIEWFDELEEEEDVDLEAEITNLLEEALEFFEKEMENYNED